MWHVKLLISLTATLLLALTAGAAAAREVEGPIVGQAVWEGEVRFAKTVVVPRGSRLKIRPGTRVVPGSAKAKLSVQGILVVDGAADRPVVFSAPEGWEGIEFMEAEAGSAIRHARFEKAKAAVSSIATDFEVRGSTFRNCESGIKLLRESSPLIEDCVFEANGIGLDNEMKSAPTVRGNRFLGHTHTAFLASHSSRGVVEGNHFSGNKQAIGLLQKYPDEIRGNRFEENEIGIFCNQTQSTPLILGNHFSKNDNALVNFSFSYPRVEQNRFVDNGTAVRNDQFGSPALAHNLFRGNGTAVYNYRKSNPKILKNQFEKNGLALYCDYSSYPEVDGNNFLGNEVGVKLGIYQSADWEKRSGSKRIVQEEARARNSQNPLLARAPTEFSDFVDVSGNWWGEDTRLLVDAGERGNVTIFHDRRDQPEVSYEGFGPESYVLDLVRFAPWLSKPVADAGPGKETP